MKNFKLWGTLIVILLLSVGLNGCYEPKPDAEAEVVEWNQANGVVKLFGPVTIDVSIRNTGQVAIDYFKVWIEAKTADGEKFKTWLHGSDLAKGELRTGRTWIEPSGKRVMSVSVGEVKLENE
ncbi:MAG: hypothetical protein ABEI54_02795 [Candidatus Bipolaricaulia bacterium]